MTEQSARDTILAAVRSAKPSPVVAPDVETVLASRPPTSADDLLDRFAAAARAAAAVVVEGALPAPSDPNTFECDAVLGVAENGAVWLPTSRLSSRAAFFLAEEVVVRLDRRAIVSDLHEAYAHIDVAAEGFGVFVAGPSKTADIEQALVVGAQGPKRLTIVITSQD